MPSRSRCKKETKECVWALRKLYEKSQDESRAETGRNDVVVVRRERNRKETEGVGTQNPTRSTRRLSPLLLLLVLRLLLAGYDDA